jgi:hypothetical protein
MKALVAMCLVASPLFCQPEAGSVKTVTLDRDGKYLADEGKSGLFTYDVLYQFSVGPNGEKILNFTVCNFFWQEGEYESALAAIGPGPLPSCPAIAQSKAETLSFVQSLESTVITWAAQAMTAYKINYGTLDRPALSLPSTATPSAPPNPFLVFVDGLSGNVMKFDLQAGSVVGQVQPPSSAIGPVGLRPGAAGSTNEVWVANQTPQVTVADLGEQSILANIATPSLPSSFSPSGIVFTNSGNTAFEAVKYFSPDSSGNNGALVVFDAVNRVVKTTFPLRYAPAVMIMAPDELTIYLLSTGGEITYYDVLSGTADLSVSTFTPGLDNGYPGTGNAFVHADGTRLFWNVGPFLEVFDLTLRKGTSQFASGLTTASAITLEVSQDGSIAIMANGQGSIILLDTLHGLVLGTAQNSTSTLAIPGN